jgi:hypothetical protein
MLRTILIAFFATTAAPFAQEQKSPARDLVVVDAATEQIIKGGLRWLATKQVANGSWSISDSRRDEHAVAMTGYVLMAFMAAGNLPEQGEFSRQVKTGMEFLLDSVTPSGEFRGVDGGKYMYNHGIASIALAELYGETRHPAMRDKLHKVIQLIVTSQSTEDRHRGGWRYQPRPADADVSVTVLQLVALRAAKNGGINVPQQTIDDAVDYVKRCAVGDSGGFAYQAGSWGAGYARTAAAIYSLQVCGLYEDALVAKGSTFLFERKFDRRHWTYGSNYAGPAQYMIGGDTWAKWYDYMKQVLVPAVDRSGELCSWRDNEVGPIYATACYVSILAMPWHYIPLYQR